MADFIDMEESRDGTELSPMDIEVSSAILYVYILKLREGKYYVGKTNNPEARIKSHFAGAVNVVSNSRSKQYERNRHADSGSFWTRKYPIIEVLEIIENCDHFDEDKYVLKTMAEHGIDNVRGGSYSTMKLSAEDIRAINKSISSAKDLCHNCGQAGHFIRNCPKQQIDKSHKEKVCERCGHDNHETSKCYARRHKDGTFLEHGVCKRCGRRNHKLSSCYAKTDRDGYTIDDFSSSESSESDQDGCIIC